MSSLQVVGAKPWLVTPDEFRHLWVSPPCGLCGCGGENQGEASLKQFWRRSSAQKPEFILLVLPPLHLLFPEQNNSLVGNRKHRDVQKGSWWKLKNGSDALGVPGPTDAE